MKDWDYGKTWYHGSPLELKIIRKGSTITQDRDIARIFSHRPSLVSFSYDENKRIIKHTGEVDGYLYCIVEDISPNDIYPHPDTVMKPGEEWLTTRELRVSLICTTQIMDEERLTDEEIAKLQNSEGY